MAISGIGKGVAEDFRKRLRCYGSDWRDGLNRRIVPAGVFIFTANLLPAIAFASFMNGTTEGKYGTTEVILSTAICNLVWAVFAGQPLIIMGITGPVALLTTTIYGVCVKYNILFLPFMFWSHFWAAIFHVILSVTNACSIVKHTTRFTCESFEVLIATVYIVKGVEEIAEGPEDAAGASSEMTLNVYLFGVLLGIGTLTLIGFLTRVRKWRYLRGWIRTMLSDYAAPLTVILCTCLTLLPNLNTIPIAKLSVPSTFSTSSGRPWLIEFWTLDVAWVFAAIVPGLILTCLFYFDHNISAIMTQSPIYNLKKPSAYHYDFLVLGCVTLLCGLIGVPAGNGLIPQAPLHTRVLGKRVSMQGKRPALGESAEMPVAAREKEVVRYTDVLEQRVSNLLQSGLTFMFLTSPFLRALAAVPRAVLGGLFLFMGFDALIGNSLFERICLFVTDPDHYPSRWLQIMERFGKKRVYSFTLLQIVLTGVTYYFSEWAPTGVGLVFPILILSLIPIRSMLLPRMFGETFVNVIDAEEEGMEEMTRHEIHAALVDMNGRSDGKIDGNVDWK